jgi:hypothetical protein
MMLHRVWLAALAVFCMCGAARADWTIASLDGAARGFAQGEWSVLSSGEALSGDILVRSDARLRLAHGGDAFVLGPNGEIKLDGDDDAILRVFKGALGATVAATHKPFLVMTSYAEIATEGATLGVVIEPYGATIAVRSGSVEVTELTSRNTAQVKAGEIFRVRAGQVGAPEPATGDEPAMAAADGAPGDAKPAPAPARKRAATEIKTLDLIPTGAIRAPDRADALPAEATAGAPREVSRTVRIVDADPLAAAAEARIGREMFSDSNLEVAPWDPHFKWTEDEGGTVRLKPLWRVVAALDGPQATKFWFLAFLTCLFWGAYAAEIMDERGFGLIGSMALIAFAFAGAMLARDAFFRADVALEPILSVGLAVCAMLFVLLGGLLAKQSFPRAAQAVARTIQTAPPSLTSAPST